MNFNMLCTIACCLLLLFNLEEANGRQEKRFLYPNRQCLDVAIIGGGVSGTYTAWKLKDQQQKIALFEYTNRIGGRLYSSKLPGMPDVVVELGGMRIITKGHQRVINLLKRLGLKTALFPMGHYNESIGPDLNIFHLRGTHFSRKNLGQEPLPYFFKEDEKNMSPQNLQASIFHKAVINSTAKDFNPLTAKTRNGQPLYQQGFWDVVSQYASNEAYRYIKQAGGYNSISATASAAMLLPTTFSSEVSADTDYQTLVGGMDGLPKLLLKEFLKTDPINNKIHMNFILQKVRKRNGRYQLFFMSNKKVVKVCAKRVVLAMPQRALENIEWAPKENDPWLSHNLNSVVPYRGMKLLLGYPRPWWQDIGLHAGRSVTDLPTRQTIYFGHGGTQNQAKPGSMNSNSVMLASYCDMENVEFWTTLNQGKSFMGRSNRYTKDPMPDTMPPISQAVVDVAHKMVAKSHNVELNSIPLPYTARLQDWAEKPYRAGWYLWRAGYRWDEVVPKMVKPLKEENVFIVGSAYSNHQGWVEGALETADYMLVNYFENGQLLHSPPVREFEKDDKSQNKEIVAQKFE